MMMMMMMLMMTQITSELFSECCAGWSHYYAYPAGLELGLLVTCQFVIPSIKRMHLDAALFAAEEWCICVKLTFICGHKL